MSSRTDNRVASNIFWTLRGGCTYRQSGVQYWLQVLRTKAKRPVKGASQQV